MTETYKAIFPEGSKVRVASRVALESFMRNWQYHHKLVSEKLKYAGTVTTVREVSLYHGGDQLYVLENVPGIWNGPCLEADA